MLNFDIKTQKLKNKCVTINATSNMYQKQKNKKKCNLTRNVFNYNKFAREFFQKNSMQRLRIRIKSDKIAMFCEKSSN